MSNEDGKIIISCPQCKTSNRVNVSKWGIFKCGSCGHVILEKTAQSIEGLSEEEIIGSSSQNSSADDNLINSGLEKLRIKLLDLTTRNRLLNFRHSPKSSLRVVDELPDELFKRLLADDLLTFKAVPEPSLNEYMKDEDGSATKPLAKDYAIKCNIDAKYDLPEHQTTNLHKKHADKYIQTLHYADDLDGILRRINSNARTAIEESGTNMLYLVFGFLEWYESDDSEVPRLAPLVSMPVSIEKNAPTRRGGLYTYSVSSSGEDISENITLREKLSHDFGLAIPILSDEDTPESYFTKFRPVLKQKKRWKIRRYITLGMCYFGKLLMYEDLNAGRSALKKHNLVKSFFCGIKRNDYEVGDVYQIDRPPYVDNIPHSIFDADSSQLSALHDALKNKNLVIEGPPGTGKSQTITNLIASALGQGKKVLFVAEKLAALEVVRRRLDEAGLGMFCLELHSHKTQKSQLLEDLKRRIQAQKRFRHPEEYERKMVQLTKKRNQLNDYVDALHSRWKESGHSPHEVLWKRERLLSMLPPNITSEINGLRFNGVNGYDKNRIDELKECFRNYTEQHAIVTHEYPCVTDNQFYGINNPNIGHFNQNEFCEAVSNWSATALYLQSHVSKLNNYNNFTSPLSLDGILTLTRKLALPPLLGISYYDVLPDIFKERDRLTVFSESVNTYRNEWEALKGHFISDKPLSPSYIADAIRVCENAHVHKLTNINCSKLQKLCDEFVQIYDAITNIAGTYDIVCKTLGLSNIDCCEILDSFPILKASLKSVPLEALHCRQAAYFEPNSERSLKSIYRKASKIKNTREQLSLIFNMDDLPEQEEIKSTLAELDKFSFFKRLFSSTYRGIRNNISQYLLARKRVSHGYVIKHLCILLRFLEDNKAFNTNEEYVHLIGKDFDGVDSDFDSHIKCCGWQLAVAQSCDALSIGSTLKQIFGVTAETSFRTLNAVLDNESLDVSINHLIQNDAFIKKWLGSNNSLQDLIANVESKISNIKSAVEIFSFIKKNDDFVLKDVESLLRDAERLNSIMNDLNSDDNILRILDHHYEGINSNIDELSGVLEYISNVCCAELPDEFKTVLLSKKASDIHSELSRWLQECEQILSSYIAARDNAITLGNINYRQLFGRIAKTSGDPEMSAVINRLTIILSAKDKLEAWIDYVKSRNVLAEAGCESLIKHIEAVSISGDILLKAAEYILYNSFTECIIKDVPELLEFNGKTHEQTRLRFQKLDKEMMELQRQRIAALVSKHHVPIGNGTGPVGTYTDLELIQRQISLQRRHIPIRQLVRRAGHALMALKPCFMMGPMSVAQYLEPGLFEFDLLVMDEASQLKPEDALGAIGRAKQIVIVGDPKQLPPTTFFERMTGSDDDDNDEDATLIEDTESILDVASSLYRPVRRLNWHYRSRHESLIAFSNREFYRDELTVFPSPSGSNGGLGIKYIHVKNGCYEKGRNPGEAKTVVEEIAKHMMAHPEESLGVATMNIRQKELIERLFDERSSKDPFIQRYISSRQKGSEPFFVKNLENVQGDERDVIIVSTTFGRDANNNFYQRFGPITLSAGHRRLNVLFTRAKLRTVIVTSINPDDIKTEGTSLGVKAFRGYLQYARSGILEQAKPTGGEAESDFEEAVGSCLTSLGYTIVPQVGVAGFRIDIAVSHPKKPGKFIIGIECDGASYHSAKSARDRDRLRQTILENLGWKIYRIWSTDWFKHRETEVQKIDSIIKKILETEKDEIEESYESYNEAVCDVEADITEEEKKNMEAVRERFSVDEARKQLIDLRENVIAMDYPDADPSKNILRNQLVDILLKHKPTNKEAWLTCIPREMREHTDGRQVRYLDKVFQILEDLL